MAVKTFGSERLTSTDINTYLANSGLVYVKQQTVGTAVTSVTVSNAFSADYENYRIVISGSDFSSAGQIFGFRLGSTTTSYYGSLYYDNAITGSNGTARSNNGSDCDCGVGGTTNDTLTSFDVGTPFLAQRTAIHGTYHGDQYSGWFGGQQADVTSFTAFTILVPTGTMTGGTITVYGYRKA